MRPCEGDSRSGVAFYLVLYIICDCVSMSMLHYVYVHMYVQESQVVRNTKVSLIKDRGDSCLRLHYLGHFFRFSTSMPLVVKISWGFLVYICIQRFTPF